MSMNQNRVATSITKQMNWVVTGKGIIQIQELLTREHAIINSRNIAPVSAFERSSPVFNNSRDQTRLHQSPHDFFSLMVPAIRYPCHAEETFKIHSAKPINRYSRNRQCKDESHHHE
jgi:hypothetical protein